MSINIHRVISIGCMSWMQNPINPILLTFRRYIVGVASVFVPLVWESVCQSNIKCSLGFLDFYCPTLQLYSTFSAFAPSYSGDVRHKAMEHVLQDMLLVESYQQTPSSFKYWGSLNLPVPVQRKSSPQCRSIIWDLGDLPTFHPTPASPSERCGGSESEREEHSAARSSDSEHLRQQVT